MRDGFRPGSALQGGYSAVAVASLLTACGPDPGAGQGSIPTAQAASATGPQASADGINVPSMVSGLSQPPGLEGIRSVLRPYWRSADRRKTSSYDDRFAARQGKVETATTIFMDWAEKNWAVSDVVRAPPCQLPATEAELGQVCCLRGRVEQVGTYGWFRMMLGDETVSAIQLRSRESPILGTMVTMCGMVTALERGRLDGVPVVVGFLVPEQPRSAPSQR